MAPILFDREEVQWPLLLKAEKVDMAIAKNYREEAAKHFSRSNLSYQKAEEFTRRGMTEVAKYYSDDSAFHKSQYEQYNSIAAALIMQVHSSNNDDSTIDFHYLRVDEAKEALDLFIDTHIQNMKEDLGRDIRASKSRRLFFITGRGLHSRGLPKIKPAIIRRLEERGLRYSEQNPGLLVSTVSAFDDLTNEIRDHRIS